MFWQLQRRARVRTAIYIFIFALLAFGIAYLIDAVMAYLAREGEAPPIKNLGIIFLVATFLIAGFYYLTFVLSGGAFVARTLGGKEVSPHTTDLKEKQLLNIVDEMAVASRQPKPQVFILEAKEINALAAGVKPEKAVIAVTRGALHDLNRDELQGVIGHEFGHIANLDMKVNMRLAAMVMGFVFMFYLGVRLLEGSFLFGRGGNGDGRKGGNPTAIIALVFLLAGAVTWFAGAILRSMVSRQREYLADATSVQYTRNPSGLANALKKIARQQDQHVAHDMPKSGMAYSHLYFNNRSFWATLFATHPPIEKRIEAIEKGA